MCITARNVKQLLNLTSLLKKVSPTHQLHQLQYNNKEKENMNNEMNKCFPYFTEGIIVKGFNRGSKELGIPTANYPLEVVKKLPEALNTGVYYGWANVDNDEVYKMVMSIGLNPFYDNKERSMETHIIHNFDRDFYGQCLKVCIVGFLRNQQNFESLEKLIVAIKADIEKAKELLDNEENQQLKKHKFFNEPISETHENQTVQINGDKLLENGS